MMPYYHGIFVFNDLLDNSVTIKLNMVRKNQRTVLRKKRKKFFTGFRKEECQSLNLPLFSELDTLDKCSPAKKIFL